MKTMKLTGVCRKYFVCFANYWLSNWKSQWQSSYTIKYLDFLTSTILMSRQKLKVYFLKKLSFFYNFSLKQK